MKKIILAAMAMCALSACHSNPYDGVGPVKNPNGPTPQTKPVPVYQLNGTADLTAQEGVEIVQKFDIRDDANIQGPFRIYLSGCPDGTTVNQVSNTQFEIHFTPDANFVKGQANRLVQAQVHIANPDGKFIDQAISWNIKNVPVAPYVVGPVALSAVVGSTLDFTVLAEDINGESFPHFSILAPTDQSTLTGIEVLLNTNAKNIFPSTQYSLSWVNVPATLVGQTVNIQVQACNSTYQLCSTQTIQVKVMAQ